MKIEKLVKFALKKDSNTSSKVAVAVITGVAVGAALSVLFAPESGKETQRNIGNTGKKFTDFLKDLAAEIRDKFFEEQKPVALLAAAEEKPKRKAPKSDIKELVHEAHQAQSN